MLEGWDKVFLAKGITCRYFAGEIGAVAWLDKGASFEPREGWRHQRCMVGNWERYKATLLRYNALMNAWNAANDGRFLGGAILTQSAYGVGWDHFMLDKRHLLDLAEALG